jgi:hypothetical protein
MKMLVDCVTTASPSKCSSTVIFKTAVERLLAERDDVFFYWLIPSFLSEEEKAFYPQDERIRYLPIKQTKDRVREYLTMPQELWDACSFWGPCWDFDVLLTMRTGLVPQMRLLMNSPRSVSKWWVKEVWLIDVMPMLKFKQTVPSMVPELHDRFTLAGYQAADRLWFVSYFEPKGVARAARQHLAPSQAMSVIAKIKTGVTAQSDVFTLKPVEKQFQPGKPFGLAFIGRMEKANGIEDIATVLENAWIMRGDNVKQIVCTVSQVVKTFDEDLVDVRFPPREEFWNICREEIDAFVYISKEGAISLSVLEPLMLGVPCITLRDEARELMLGKDYPFYANGPAQVYGVFKALYDDYEGSYAKFAEWHKNWFQPTWKQRFKDDLIYPQLVEASHAFDAKLEARKEELGSLGQNQTVQDIAELRIPGETMYETIRREGSGKFGVLVKKTDPVDHDGRNITFKTPFNSYRLGLKLFHGLVDASVEPGHLK